ncbi:hypothetical protein UFOVP260_25 [uncultured Caudovirales phage]|uniref:Uncharacterized protein n=1 Tax=uncultured Caudovirales phage TaxID=2100421 RepID=A0A6J5LHQ3_9CAUD|nr:hypothetical protein UFOVP85_37 [uncultured Caudovirales phage]CAB4132470.1 hypothetical protein UFOVP260_25 [uncultured Caudovirales phage]CAB4202584.1 hypothetical protein UFOVP1363_20 [uncultured Caudovirales phage]CAB5207294.1 hypothetical protein UFOVP179_54 [uncultured Caudovirales phage]
MINYWWEITQEKEYDGFTVTIKANSDTICVQDYFDTEDDAELYATTYLRGYRDALGDFNE